MIESGLERVAIRVNGQTGHFDVGTTVADIVETACESSRGVAVARNGEVVPKSRWNTETVSAGDAIEILAAAAGG